jgi:D-3-phosphoglycerate dehydrogenase
MAVRQLRDYLENGNITNSVNFPNVSIKKREGTRIVILHRNVPGMLGDLSQILGKRGINIIRLQNDSKGDFAATILDVEKEEVSVETETLLREHADVVRVCIIPSA